jgi:hypothetical protein
MLPRYRLFRGKPRAYGEPAGQEQEPSHTSQNEHGLLESKSGKELGEHDREDYASDTWAAEDDTDGGGSTFEKPVGDDSGARRVKACSSDTEEEMAEQELVVDFAKG